MGDTRSSKRKVSPSKVRYDKKNPVISFRANLEVMNSLRRVRELTGKSNKTIILQLLNKNSLDKVASLSEKKRKAIWRSAREKYEIQWLCSKCNRGFPITDVEMKHAVETLLITDDDFNWVCGNCSD